MFLWDLYSSTDLGLPFPVLSIVGIYFERGTTPNYLFYQGDRLKLIGIIAGENYVKGGNSLNTRVALYPFY